MLIVDTGVILAVADHAGPDHVACVEVVERTDLLVTTHLVIAEAAYIIARQLGQQPKQRSSVRSHRATCRSKH